MTRILKSRITPLVATILIAAATAASISIATVRTKVQAGETVEILAERYYGDAKWANLLRAANRLSDGEQPKDGAFFKIPGPIIHSVQLSESIEDISDEYLEGEGSLELLAEANQMSRDAQLKRGDVVTVFAEIRVQTGGLTAEALAKKYLGDENLGARIRRYNGVKDGGDLGKNALLPLVGLEPRRPTSDETKPPVVVKKDDPPRKDVVPVEPPKKDDPPPKKDVPSDKVIAKAPDKDPDPDEDPDVDPPVGGNVDMSIPVTGKRATIEGFTHALHTPMTIGGVSIGCMGCHQRKPGTVEHVPPRAANCTICHRESDKMPESIRKGRPQRLSLETNHAIHMAPDSEVPTRTKSTSERLKGINCQTCHKPSENAFSGIGWVGHTACAKCHAAGKSEPYVQGDASGKYCLSCHGDVEVVDKRGAETRFLRAHLVPMRGRAGDNAFNHLTHINYGKPGAPQDKISCQTCHADVPKAGKNADIELVTMQGCVECHRQATAVGMQPPTSCKGCHLHLRKGFPPAGDVLTNKPINHTPFFRVSHSQAARDNPALCATCHKGVDPADGTRCDTCHRVMKPRDHTAGYRDKVHGRMAQMDSTRCQTCHRAERCESCHSVIPNSHLPLRQFTDGNFLNDGRPPLHASRARLDLGSCLTCHRFETSCSRCHTGSQ